MEVKHTERNFEIIEFKDSYGEKCTLQQSSLAIYTKPGTSAVWLGANRNRMHLKEKQLKELISHLYNWLRHGTFVL